MWTNDAQITWAAGSAPSWSAERLVRDYFSTPELQKLTQLHLLKAFNSQIVVEAARCCSLGSTQVNSNLIWIILQREKNPQKQHENIKTLEWAFSKNFLLKTWCCCYDFQVADVHFYLISNLKTWILFKKSSSSLWVLYFGEWTAALVYTVKDFAFLLFCRGKKIKKCELDTQCQYCIEIWKMYIRVFIIKSC